MPFSAASQQQDPRWGSLRSETAGQAQSLSGQFLRGWFQGFTTIPSGRDPETGTEAIARSVGSLLGFFGWMPGSGVLNRLAFGGIGRLSASLGMQAANQGLVKTGGALGRASARAELMANAPRLKSLPMAAGEGMVHIIGGAARKSAMLDASRLLGQHTFGRDIAKGIVMYGTAAGVTGWPGGPQEMAKAALYGGMFGVVDRGFGNLLPHKGPQTPGLFTLFGRDGAENAGMMALRSLSGAAIQGGMSSWRQDPIELQVYEYLLGAFFTGVEMPRHSRTAMAKLRPIVTDPFKRGQLPRALVEGREAELIPDWATLPEAVRDDIRIQAEFEVDRWFQLGGMEGPNEQQARQQGRDRLTKEEFDADAEAISERTGATLSEVVVARGLRQTIGRWMGEMVQNEQGEWVHAGGKLNADEVRYFVEKGLITEQMAQRYSADGGMKPDDVRRVAAAMISQRAMEIEAAHQKRTVSSQGGFDARGRGTPQGDGKDAAMRKQAHRAIVELAPGRRGSSSQTSLDALGPYKPRDGGIVMLARNGNLKNRPLRPETMEAILGAHEDGAVFVVGDMPGVDTQFVRYLDEIGASYTVYHAGESPRFEVATTRPAGDADASTQATSAIGSATPDSPVVREIQVNQFQGPDAGEPIRIIGSDTVITRDPEGNRTETTFYRIHPDDAVKWENHEVELGHPTRADAEGFWYPSTSFRAPVRPTTPDPPRPERERVPLSSEPARNPLRPGMSANEMQRHLTTVIERLRRAIEDHDAPSTLLAPVRQVAEDIVSRMQAAEKKATGIDPDIQGTVARMENVTHELIALAAEHGRAIDMRRPRQQWLAESDQAFLRFQEAVEARYGIEMDMESDTWRGLRKTWLMHHQLSVPVNQIVWDLSRNKPRAQGTADVHGRSTEKMRGKSELDYALEAAYRKAYGEEPPIGLRSEMTKAEMRARPGEQGQGRRGHIEDIHRAEGVDDVDIILGVARMGDADGPGAQLVIGGRKDAGTILIGRAVVSRADADAVIRENLDAIEAMRGDGDPSFWAAFRRDRDNFVARAQEKGASAAEALNTYNWTYANNIRLIEAMNDMSFADMFRANREGGQFVLDAVNLNKRLQVIDAGEARLSQHAFDGTFGYRINDLRDDGGLSIELVNAVPKGGGLTHPIEGGKGRLGYYVLNNQGKAEWRTSEAHVDGAFMLRDDVFEALARWSGWETDTGSQKGVATQVDPQGLLIGKYAYHRAGPEQSASMVARGAHGQMYDTSAKQRGTRPIYNQQLKADGTVAFYRPGSTQPVTPEPISLRPDALTVNLSTGESSQGAMKTQTLMMQAHTNLLMSQTVPGRTPDAAIRAYVEQMVEASIRGVDAENAKAKDYLDILDGFRDLDVDRQHDAIKRLNEIAESIDVDGLGLEQIVNLLRGPTQVDTPLYRNLVRKILDAADDDIGSMAEADFNSFERKAFLEGFAEARSATDKVLAVMEPTPLVMYETALAPIKPYFERALMGHIMRRVFRPKVDGSIKAVMAPLDPFLQQKLIGEGRELQRGQFLLHDGAGAKEIPWETGIDGVQTTKRLSEAWAEFEDAGGWKSAPGWMRDAMEFVSSRSPADSVSGMRVSRFMGFTGRKGYGAVFHPEDMSYMGGADLDIDTGFLYPTRSIPREMVDQYRHNAREWEVRAKTETGQEVWARIPSKVDDPEIARHFGAGKLVDWFPDGGGSDPDLRNPALMASPSRLLEAHRGATGGNSLLGEGLNHANRYLILVDGLTSGQYGRRGVLGARRTHKKDKLDVVERGETYVLADAVDALREAGHIPENANKVWWTAQAPADGGIGLRLAKMNVVNYAADSPDYPGLLSRDQLGHALGRVALDNMQVWYSVKDARGNESIHRATGGAELVSAAWNTHSGALSQAMRLTKGRDYRTTGSLGLDELWHGYELPGNNRGAFGVSAARREFTGREGSTLVRALRRLSEISLPDDRTFTEMSVKVRRDGIHEKTRFVVPPWLGAQYPRTLEAFDQLMSDRTEFGHLVRQLVGRTGLTVLTSRGGERPYETGHPRISGTRQHHPDRAQEIEFPRQDVWDVVSTVRIYQEARSLYDAAGTPESRAAVIQELNRIANSVTFLKREHSKLLGMVESEVLRSGDHISKAETFEDLTRNADALFETVTPEYRAFAESYYLGSLRYQDPNVAYRNVPAIQRANRAYKKALESKDQAEINAAREQVEKVKDLYFETNMDSKGLMVGAVGPEGIRRYYNQLKDLAEASWRYPLSMEDMRYVFEYGSLMDSPRLDAAIAAAREARGESPRDPITGEGFATQGNSSLARRYEARDFLEDMARILEIDLDAAVKDPRQREMLQEMEDRIADLAYANPQLMKNFPEFFAGQLSKVRASDIATVPEHMTMIDLREFLGYFGRLAGRDPWTEEIEERRERGAELKWYHYFWWPERTGMFLDALDVKNPLELNSVAREVVAATPDGPRAMTVSQFQSSMSKVQDIWSRFNKYLEGLTHSSRHDVRQRFAYLDKLGDEGRTLFSVAVAQREYRIHQADASERTHYYAAEWRRAQVQLKDLGKKSYTVPRRNQKGEVVGDVLISGRELVNRIDNDLTQWSDHIWNSIVNNNEGWRLLPFEGIPRGEKPEDYGVDPLQHPVDVRQVSERIVSEMQAGRSPSMFGHAALSKLTHQYMIDRVRVWSATMADIVAQQQGEVRNLEQRYFGEKGPHESDTIPHDLEVAYNRLADLEAQADAGGTRLGDLHGYDKVVAQRDLLKRRPHLQYQPLESIGFDTYFPHNNHPRRLMERYMRAKQEHLAREGVSEDKRTASEILAKLEVADRNAPDLNASREAETWLMENDSGTIAEGHLARGGLKYRPGHLQQRAESADNGGPVPYYDRSPKALEVYQNQLLKAHYTQLASLISHVEIDAFRSRQSMGENTEPWARFMEMFNRDALGLPTLFPREWLTDPRMRLMEGGPLGMRNPYMFFTDEMASKNSIMRRFFGGKGSWTDGDPKLLAERIRRFSAWEGRYQLAALLSHSKTWVQNYTFGNVNTAISAGWGTWAKAKNIAWLRANVNPEWTSMQDAYRFVESFGGVENYIVSEVALPDRARVESVGAFINDFRAEIRKGGLSVNMEASRWDYTVGQLLEKHGLSQRFMDTAGFMMRHSEYKLRTNAWLAHYIQWREVLGMNGGAFPADHPWLIQLANRGVAATQFLYDNANRPAFARTNLGRIFSRFQLWGWNSIRFRRDIYQDANRMGFREGSPEMAKLNRLAMADLFVLGLAEIFPMSMFDAGLAPPLQWAKDLSLLFFGDEDERDRAFFGLGKGFGPLASLSLFQPPILRGLSGFFASYFSGDMRRFWDYHIWLWFPFGRVSRDIARTYDNPMRVIEQMTGFPLHRTHAQMRRWRAEPPTGPGRPTGPTPNYALPDFGDGEDAGF